MMLTSNILFIILALSSLLLPEVNGCIENQSAEFKENHSRYRVSIFPGVLPSSENVPVLPWLGHWVYGDVPQAESDFFRTEDTHYAVWLLWKRELSKQESQQEEQINDARKKKHTNEKTTVEEEYFTATAITRRGAIYKSLLQKDTLPDEENSLKLLNLVIRLEQAIRNKSLSLSDLNRSRILSSSEQSINALAHECFAHTIYHLDESKRKKSLSLLPHLWIVDLDILHKARLEQRELQAVVDNFYTKILATSTNTNAYYAPKRIARDISERMHNITQMLMESQRAIESIYTLSYTLYPLAAQQVNKEKERVKHLLLRNDGANKAQEAQMKFLTKKLSRLKAWSTELEESYAQIKSFNQAGKLTSKSGKLGKGSEQACMTSLILISLFRLNCRVNLSMPEVLPEPPISIFTRMTGLVSCDVSLATRSVLNYGLILALLLYVFITGQSWTARSVLRTAAHDHKHHSKRSMTNKIYRILFFLSYLCEKCVQLFSLVLAWAVFGTNMHVSPMLLVACMDVFQRILFGLLCLVGTVGFTNILSRIMHCAFPLPPRQQSFAHTKKKR